jgi:hypothetical protein
LPPLRAISRRFSSSMLAKPPFRIDL